MENFKLIYAKALYLRFCTIYGDKFVKSYHDDDFRSLWAAEWSTGLAGINPTLIKGALETCKLTLEWPPSLAEFRRICEQADGVPSCTQALEAAVGGKFDHPVTFLAYSKVGSWSMKNDKASLLGGKFQVAYIEALNEFRKDYLQSWQKLDKFKERIALPPPPSKIPSSEEIIGLRERLAKYKALANAEKLKIEAKDHPVWDQAKIIRGGKQFDEKHFQERRSYLIGTEENLAGTLSRDDWYDRIRFLRELEAQGCLKGNRPIQTGYQKTKVTPRACNVGNVIYGKWKD
jgi:hypothetical protein